MDKDNKYDIWEYKDSDGDIWVYDRNSGRLLFVKCNLGRDEEKWAKGDQEQYAYST